MEKFSIIEVPFTNQDPTLTFQKFQAARHASRNKSGRFVARSRRKLAQEKKPGTAEKLARALLELFLHHLPTGPILRPDRIGR